MNVSYPGPPTPPHALVPPPPGAGAPPAPRDAAPGVLEGLKSPFRGFGFILAHGDTWPLAAVPLFMGMLVTIGLSSLGVHFGSALLDQWLPSGSGLLLSLVAVLAKAVGLVLVVAMSLALGLVLAQPLSGPALERLVRKVDAELGLPPWPETSFLTDVGRSFMGLLLPLAFGVPVLVGLFLLTFFVPPAAVFAVPAKIVVTALLLAWDLCDYPLSVRGVPLAERIAFLSRHKAAVLGFGLALVLLALVPCSLFLVLPAGACGAARLVASMERHDPARRALLGAGLQVDGGAGSR
jgi:CysZ protein